MPPDPLYAPGSAYHTARRWTHPYTVKCLETAVNLLGKPASLVDIGCAEGVLVDWARERQIDAMGVDLAVAEGAAHLVRADLRGRLDLGRQFQWVICWEVAEHLPEIYADRLCKTLVRHMEPGGRILFTAAPPGQRGPGHVNLRPVEYWMEKFIALGMAYAAEPTDHIAKAWRLCAGKTPWYWKNLQIYWRVA